MNHLRSTLLPRTRQAARTLVLWVTFASAGPLMAGKYLAEESLVYQDDYNLRVETITSSEQPGEQWISKRYRRHGQDILCIQKSSSPFGDRVHVLLNRKENAPCLSDAQFQKIVKIWLFCLTGAFFFGVIMLFYLSYNQRYLHEIGERF